MKKTNKQYNVLKANLEQIKYDCQEMINKIKAIENARNLIIEFKGSPKEETCKDAIRIWKKDYLENKLMFETYIERYKKIDNEL